jgi:phage-related protein (TIGR01555 family)
MFRQSPKAFTGDADLANYYGDVGTQQERDLRPHIRLLFDVLHRSEFGEPLPDDFTFEFNPLWQMSDVDRSTVATNTLTRWQPLCVIWECRHAALTDLRELSDVTGIGAN